MDQIRVVLPEETEDLKINTREDYVTLVTCTPYGINTHRLLVRGTRVPYEEEREQSDGELRKGSWLEQYRLAAFAGLSVVLAAAAGGFLWRRVRKKR